ncbi:MAG: hypothetical protein ACLR3C_17165 [Eggerthella lenta]
MRPRRTRRPAAGTCGGAARSGNARAAYCTPSMCGMLAKPASSSSSVGTWSLISPRLYAS